jgi:microsomal dipeptidase-like Zn-dependent dipeptidase
MSVTSRRVLLVIFAPLAGMAALLAALLPGAIEAGMNRVRPHELPAVGAVARDLHTSVPVADLHADSLLWTRDLLERASRGHLDVPRMIEGGMALQVFTAATVAPMGQNYEGNERGLDPLTALVVVQRWPLRTWLSPMERAMYQAEKLADLERRAGGRFRLIRNRGDLQGLLAERAGGESVVGGIFGIEGGHALEGDLSNLERLDAAGLRVVGLTHFFDNRLGGSLHGMSRDGLTDFGRRVVVEAVRRGMIVDVAHASPAMVREVLAISDRPVILSHGGFRGACDTARNLDDDLMREIAAHGGLVGVGFWDGAVCDITPEGVVRSLRYGIDLMGVDHVALGSDWDGGTEVSFDAGELPALTQAMLDAGFSAEEIRKVLGGNAVRFLLENLP